MISKEMIERINELARKKKSEGLTAEELEEQQGLYKTYLASVKEQTAAQLETAGIHKKGEPHVCCNDGCCGEHGHHHGPDTKHIH